MPAKVASALLLVASLAAAAPSGDWSRVQDLRVGLRVVIRRAGGEIVRGRLAAAGAEGITVRAESGAVEIPRSAVAEVRKSRSRLIRAAQFGGIGAGVGIGLAAVLLAATGGSDETAEIVVQGAAIGGALGAAAGAAAPAGRTVYQASGN